MKTKISFEEAFQISETLHGVMKESLPKELKLYEMKSLFMLKKFKTNNLKEIKERISKDFYHIPKPILEVKIAKVIASLMKLGLLTKEKLAEDKRQVLLNITPKGEELLERVHAETKQLWEEAYNG